MITAFVAGATGYTGAEVVRQLATSDARVVAHVRPDSSALPLWRGRFDGMGAVVDVTPWRSDAVRASLAVLKPDIVFALLGTTRARARAAQHAGAAPSGYEEVDYGLTHMLLSATRAAAPAACFVYLSAMGATAGTRSEYMRVRVRIEAKLHSSGLRFVIARPGLVTGTDRAEPRAMENAARVVLGGAAALLSRLGALTTADRVRPITAQRLARALIVSAVDVGGRRAVDGNARDTRARGVILGAADLQRLGRT